MKLAAVGDNCMDVYENTGKAYPGGNPVNVAVYFVRLGGEASYTGVVGTDKYGTLMKEKITEKGVDTSHIRFEEGNTAITHVELIDGERVFGEYEEGVLADFKTIPLIFDLDSDTPLNRRNAPEFKTYFNLIWKELNTNE